MRKHNDIVAAILRAQADKLARQSARLPVPPSIKREPSKTEESAAYRGPGFGLLFCPHGKSYFDLCSACKRDRLRATAEYERFCNRYGVEI
jgi:hypothetical protein